MVACKISQELKHCMEHCLFRLLLHGWSHICLMLFLCCPYVVHMCFVCFSSGYVCFGYVLFFPMCFACFSHMFSPLFICVSHCRGLGYDGKLILLLGLRSIRLCSCHSNNSAERAGARMDEKNTMFILLLYLRMPK